MKKYLLILFLSISAIACEDKEKINGTPTVSKVIFSRGFGDITVFSFETTVPVPGVYTKLALWAEGRNYELDKIDNPESKGYTMRDLQLPYDDRIPNKNYFLWTKKDGTTLKQPVTY